MELTIARQRPLVERIACGAQRRNASFAPVRRRRRPGTAASASSACTKTSPLGARPREGNFLLDASARRCALSLMNSDINDTSEAIARKRIAAADLADSWCEAPSA